MIHELIKIVNRGFKMKTLKDLYNKTKAAVVYVVELVKNEVCEALNAFGLNCDCCKKNKEDKK